VRYLSVVFGISSLKEEKVSVNKESDLVEVIESIQGKEKIVLLLFIWFKYRDLIKRFER
jgi:hypothetical protein